MTDDDEVCIPSLSSILLAVQFVYFLLSLLLERIVRIVCSRSLCVETEVGEVLSGVEDLPFLAGILQSWTISCCFPPVCSASAVACAAPARQAGSSNLLPVCDCRHRPPPPAGGPPKEHLSSQDNPALHTCASELIAHSHHKRCKQLEFLFK